MRHFYITTTLPYVNAEPHIGFALEIVQADFFARAHRERGAKIIFNTGTDEHGQKIYKNALEAGLAPKVYCDQFAAKFHELKDLLNLSYTNFIRTTDDHHIAAAQEFWRRCEKNGDIYKARYQAKYCVGCELEKTDSDLVDDRCPIHPKLEIELRDEENYFFRWSKYQEQLSAHYLANQFVLPVNRQAEIANFVAAGLRDFSISRLAEKMPWGIPVPGDEAHVMYVWFDALVNYISTLGWPGTGQFDDYWPGVQVAGKDNLRQQSAMWPAMLLSAGLPLPKQIFIHGFITANGEKMSKSLGNVIAPKDLVAEFGVEAVRYYLLREIKSDDDGDYSSVRMEERYAELANQLGNLVSRVAAMSEKYFASVLPAADLNFSTDQQILEAAIDAYNPKKYLDAIFAVVASANDLVDKQAPFKLVKVDPERAKQVLAELATMIRWVGLKLAPALPATSAEILRRYSGDAIIVGDPLFPRRDI
jgi:methionyl-tRNA synthetase